MGFSAITGIAIYATKLILTKTIHIHMSQYTYYFVIVAIAGIVALITYCGLSYYSGLLGEFLGSRFKKKINN
jgi:hypothetical protein